MFRRKSSHTVAENNERKMIRVMKCLAFMIAIAMTTTVFFMLLQPAYTYFSDTHTEKFDILAYPTKPLEIQNLQLATHAGIKTDAPVTNAETGEIVQAGNEYIYFDNYLLSDIVTLSFDVVNLEEDVLTLTDSKLKLAWTDVGGLGVKGAVYIYPASMSDTEIRNNINANNANFGQLALSHSLADTQLTMNNGASATGLVYPLAGFSTAPETLAPAGSPGDRFTYSVKIAFVRHTATNGYQEHAPYLDYHQQTLKVDIEVNASRALATMVVPVNDCATVELLANVMPMMKAGTNGAANATFWGQTWINKQDVETATFLDVDVKAADWQLNWQSSTGKTIINAWDVSVAGDGIVMAWYSPAASGTVGKYDLFIGGRNGVLGNSGAFAYLFSNFSYIKSIDCSLLQVGVSTSLIYMFNGTANLQSLVGYENFDTRNCTTLANMFTACGKTAPGITDLDLRNWDVSNVTSMVSMFQEANKLVTVDTTGWNTAANLSFAAIFNGCSVLTTVHGVEQWDTGSATAVHSLFRNCQVFSNGGTGTIDLSGWDVSQVTSLNSLFQSVGKLEEIDLSGWDTGQATTATHTFYGCSILKVIHGLEDWDTSQMATITNFVRYCTNFDNNGTGELDLSGWDTGSITSMEGMLANISGITKIDATGWKFNTKKNVEVSLKNLFSNNPVLEMVVGIEDWKTDNVKDATGLFIGCGAMKQNSMNKLDLSGWNVSSITAMTSMFNGMKSLTVIDTTGWITTNNKSFQGMFSGCNTLQHIPGLESWNTSGALSMESMFANCQAFSNNATNKLDLTGWSVDAVTSMGNMFQNVKELEEIKTTGWNTTENKSLANMFSGCAALLRVPGLEAWDTINVSAMNSVFQGCSNLINNEQKKLDLTGWNISEVTTMEHMFHGAASLEIIDTTGWQFSTTSEIKMSNVFDGCIALTQIKGIEQWKTEQFTTAAIMFRNCSALTQNATYTLDLSGWNVSNVENMANMFYGVEKIQIINTTGWITTENTTCENMFRGCTALVTVSGIESWNTENVEKMSSMFQGCYAFTNGTNKLDLSGWDTKKVTTTAHMFNGVKLIERMNLSTWQTPLLTTVAGMFSNTSALTWVDMSSAVFSSSITNTSGNYNAMFSGSKMTSAGELIISTATANWMNNNAGFSPKPATITAAA